MSTCIQRPSISIIFGLNTKSLGSLGDGVRLLEFVSHHLAMYFFEISPIVGCSIRTFSEPYIWILNTKSLGSLGDGVRLLEFVSHHLAMYFFEISPIVGCSIRTFSEPYIWIPLCGNKRSNCPGHPQHSKSPHRRR